MNRLESNPDEYRSLGKPIEELDSGRRIDEYLSGNFPFLSRNVWKKKVKEKEVLVNGKEVRASYRLKYTDSICYFQPIEVEPEVNKNIQVVWEEAGVKAIYKPSNLPMHEGGRYFKNTFAEVVKEKIGEEWSAVHRLDRETSGIVLCAGTMKLRGQLSIEFRDRVMKKTYTAIAKGVPKLQDWLVDEKIGDDTNSSFRLKKGVVADGQPSQTHFKLLDKTDTHSYLKVSPRTGRTHQIRVHAAWYGLPLVGDKKYYPDESVYIEYMDHGLTDRVVQLTESKRLCLHATSLSFVHPVTEKLSEIHCPVPDDMESVWTDLKN